MFEEDRAPVALSKIDHLTASCQRTVKLAYQRSLILEQFPPLDPLSGTLVAETDATGTRLLVEAQLKGEKLFVVFRSSIHQLGQLLGYSRAAARNVNPDAPCHPARAVLLNV
jgi:hypothetical protein